MRAIRASVLLLTASVAPADDAIDAYVRAEMELNSIPGLALAVVDDREVVFQKAYGIRRVGSAELLTVDTPLELASVSKSLTAAGVAVDERGFIAVDEQILFFDSDGKTGFLHTHDRSVQSEAG